MGMLVLKVEGCKPSRYFIEKPGSQIVHLKNFPMGGAPGGVREQNIANPASNISPNRNREPEKALRRLDAVPIAPIFLRILHVIIENKFVHRSDHIEIALPRDIIGLDARHAFHWCFAGTGRIPITVRSEEERVHLESAPIRVPSNHTRKDAWQGQSWRTRPAVSHLTTLVDSVVSRNAGDRVAKFPTHAATRAAAKSATLSSWSATPKEACLERSKPPSVIRAGTCLKNNSVRFCFVVRFVMPMKSNRASSCSSNQM